nr:protein kinase-like domain-containing protein [Tanacetum cinerariifolium]
MLTVANTSQSSLYNNTSRPTLGKEAFSDDLYGSLFQQSGSVETEACWEVQDCEADENALNHSSVFSFNRKSNKSAFKAVLICSEIMFGIYGVLNGLTNHQKKNCNLGYIVTAVMIAFGGVMNSLLWGLYASEQLMEMKRKRVKALLWALSGCTVPVAFEWIATLKHLNLSFLRMLSVSNNSFQGTVPHLYLDANKLSGVIPTNLSGVLPISIDNLFGQLTFLNLGENQLFGSLPSSIGHIPSCHRKCKELTVLSLRDNRLSGKIPKQILQLPLLTIGLDLSQNSLSGSIPLDIKDLKMLNILDLSYDNLSGTITSSLGKIPQLFDRRFSLEFLNLSFNDFEGEVPIGGVIANASVFSVLGNNKLCGGLVTLELPKCKETANLIGEGGFSSVYKGVLDADADRVKVLHLLNRGALKSFLAEYVATTLDYLHIRCQTTIVHGDLKPSNILLDDDMVANVGDFGLARLLEADLKRNSSAGVIGTIGYAPPEYGIRSEMTSSGDVYSFGILLLELMTGKKPTDDMFNEGLSIHKFAYMALPDHVVAVSGSDSNAIKCSVYHHACMVKLRGEVPIGGVFANASVFSVLGNNKHCGGLVTLELPKCKEMGNKKKRCPYLLLLILIAPMLLIVLYCVRLFCKKKHNRQPSQSSRNERFLKVSYNELLKATDGFSIANLIGEGGFSSVYKGVLDSDADRVKVLHLQNRGALKSFLAECEAWRNIRHHLKRNSSAGVIGTIGYAPPEYGIGSEMTSSGDVYSFGILLLELMTGKKPTDDMFNEGRSIHKLASMALPDHVTDVIDVDGIVLQSTEGVSSCLYGKLRVTARGELCMS